MPTTLDHNREDGLCPLGMKFLVLPTDIVNHPEESNKLDSKKRNHLDL